MADATSPNKVVAGYELKPASQGTIFAMQEVAKKFEEYATEEEIQSSGDVENPGVQELLEVGLAVLVFADARRCYDVARNGGISDLRYEAEGIVWDLPIEVAMELSTHFSHEMSRVKELTGEKEASQPGKPQTSTGSLNNEKNPPQVTDSPS